MNLDILYKGYIVDYMCLCIATAFDTKKIPIGNNKIVFQNLFFLNLIFKPLKQKLVENNFEITLNKIFYL